MLVGVVDLTQLLCFARLLRTSMWQLLPPGLLVARGVGCAVGAEHGADVAQRV